MGTDPHGKPGVPARKAPAAARPVFPASGTFRPAAPSFAKLPSESIRRGVFSQNIAESNQKVTTSWAGFRQGLRATISITGPLPL